MSSLAADVLIAGAGIAGAACAAACTRAGLSVIVIEPDRVGGGASAEGMGHLVVMDDSDAQFSLCRYSRGRWNALAPELPASAEYHACGTIWVAADDEELAAARGKARWYEQRGEPVELLDAATLRSLEPALRPDLAGGLRVPGDGVVYAPLAAEHLIAEAQRRGAVLRLGHHVTRLGGRGAALDDGTDVSAGVTINAAGIAAGRLTPGLDIRPRRGHLAITDRYPGLVRHQLVELGYLHKAHASDEDSVAFNVQPRPSGQLLIGSSRQYDKSEREIDPTLLARMLRRSLEFMPTLSDLRVLRAWTGMRSAGPDALPLIGPWPDDPGLWITAAHEGLGITTSLGAADLIVAGITGESPPIDPAPYRPARILEANR